MNELEALTRIAAIENKMSGGDWDEIEEARAIARAALAHRAPLGLELGRIYTYLDQPGNGIAWRLGVACVAAKPGGDPIDHGLSLLQELQANGFGVVVIDAARASQALGITKSPAAPDA